MRENILGVSVSAKTLKCTEDRWDGSKEPEQARVVGVTLGRLFPAVGIEAEEKGDVLICS